MIQDWQELEQPAQGYRYNIDSFLLARFARFQATETVCDLGAGVGILGLLALSRGKVRKVISVEVQKELADYARKNAMKWGLSDHLEVFEKNWKKISRFLKPGSFNLVLSNPPYRKKETGRLPPDKMKAIAKHEIKGNLRDLVKAAHFLLKVGGRFCVIYPPLRLEELIFELQKSGFKMRRMAFIHPYAEEAANLMMVEAIKGRACELKLEPPIVVYRNPDHFTTEVEEWVGKKKK